MASYDPNSRKPEPTRLVLLDQVRRQDSGTKIRFLGCVYDYRGDSATLVLRGEFTKRDYVKVNIQSVLEGVNHELLAAGAWLNVVGYVRQPSNAPGRQKSVTDKGKQLTRRSKAATVDALMLWSAGAVKVDEYQSAVRSFQTAALQET